MNSSYTLIIFLSTSQGALHCSIYATFQKIKTQFFVVMSTVLNVDLTMFVKGAEVECTLYILIYISE